jgi:hypothetical protein
MLLQLVAAGLASPAAKVTKAFGEIAAVSAPDLVQTKQIRHWSSGFKGEV